MGVALTNAADLAACAAAAAAEAKAAVTTRSPPFCAAEEVAGGLLEGRAGTVRPLFLPRTTGSAEAAAVNAVDEDAGADATASCADAAFVAVIGVSRGARFVFTTRVAAAGGMAASEPDGNREAVAAGNA